MVSSFSKYNFLPWVIQSAFSSFLLVINVYAFPKMKESHWKKRFPIFSFIPRTYRWFLRVILLILGLNALLQMFLVLGFGFAWNKGGLATLTLLSPLVSPSSSSSSWKLDITETMNAWRFFFLFFKILLHIMENKGKKILLDWFFILHKYLKLY